VGNDIRNVDDNCIEADGAMHNIRVLRNRCFNQAHRALSAQPLFGGPAYFIGNVVYHAPEGGPIKLQANPSGIIFYHNTFVGESLVMGTESDLHCRNYLGLGRSAWPEYLYLDLDDPYPGGVDNGFRPNPGEKEPLVRVAPPLQGLADFGGDREARRFPTL